ncbi:hypothetical protein [Pseudonocardia broussonetiae]|uniref:Uncharacterized protein n=1 Tax=Pseudonocardia broussonetiae TaxID=2736640 RepID=A0A6M6JXD0_9PSEU|nr:hypothetical protein [Pseudonocardia broussonetiae]QJY51182.1 hypothetical protein HOP40_34950 [Pseudonocardia broussonetiae]
MSSSFESSPIPSGDDSPTPTDQPAAVGEQRPSARRRRKRTRTPVGMPMLESVTRMLNAAAPLRAIEQLAGMSTRLRVLDEAVTRPWNLVGSSVAATVLAATEPVRTSLAEQVLQSVGGLSDAVGRVSTAELVLQGMPERPLRSTVVGVSGESMKALSDSLRLVGPTDLTAATSVAGLNNITPASVAGVPRLTAIIDELAALQGPSGPAAISAKLTDLAGLGGGGMTKTVGLLPSGVVDSLEELRAPRAVELAESLAKVSGLSEVSRSAALGKMFESSTLSRVAGLGGTSAMFDGMAGVIGASAAVDGMAGLIGASVPFGGMAGLIGASAPFEGMAGLIGASTLPDIFRLVSPGVVGLADLVGRSVQAALDIEARLQIQLLAAHDAAIRGDEEAVSVFLQRWMDLPRGNWRERVKAGMDVLVLEPVEQCDPDTAFDMLERVEKALCHHYQRGLMPLTQTVIGRRRVVALEALPDLTGAVDLSAEEFLPASPSAEDQAVAQLDPGQDVVRDVRLLAIMGGLTPVETTVMLAWSAQQRRSWERAAQECGLPSSEGERVRAKLKRKVELVAKAMRAGSMVVGPRFGTGR